MVGLGVLIGAIVNSFVTSCKGKKRSGKSKLDTEATEDDDWVSDESEDEGDEGLRGALLKRNAAPKKMTD